MKNKSLKWSGAELPRNTTTITLTQMSQLINHIQSSDGEAIDAEVGRLGVALDV